MERVSITFGGGVLVVKDEQERQVDVTRATVHLVAGNRSPVAVLEVGSARHEVPVSALEVVSAVAIGGAPMRAPRRKRGD